MATYNTATEANDGDSQATGAWIQGDGAYGTPTNYFRVGIVGGNYRSGGLRFPSVAVAQGATISSAILRATVQAAPGGTIEVTAVGFDSDNAAAWQSDGPIPGGQGFTDTTATYVRNITTSDVQSTDIDFDVTAIVQEIVDRVGWVSGNAMSFALRNTSGAYTHVRFYDYDTGHSSALDGRLIITLGGGGVVISRQSLDGMATPPGGGVRGGLV